MEVDIADLKVVEYLELSTLAGRHPVLQPLWTGDKWRLWIPGPEGFIEMNPVQAYQSDYLAKQPAGPNDLCIPFVDLMWQRASWPKICPLIASISADFHNFGSSVEKLTFFYGHRKHVRGATAFVKTELEYIFILSRSIFDLVHEAISHIWKSQVTLHDPVAEARRRGAQLPDSFRGMVQKGGALRTDQDLISTYGLPEGLAQAYCDSAPFFMQIRKFRDQIVHLGKDPAHLFDTEKGFCLPKTAYGFGELDFWKPEHSYNENVVSLLPLLAYVVLGTIETCNRIVSALAGQIVLPPELAPGYHVFIRAPHNEALLWLLHISQGGLAWWSERDAWRHQRIEEHAYFLWRDRTGREWWDAMSNWREAERAFELFSD